MMLLNVFTNGFHGQASTQGNKKPRFIEWVYGATEFDGVTLFEDGYMYSPLPGSVKSRYKFGWLNEQRALHPENYARIETVMNRFDLIFTYDETLLKQYPDKFKLWPIMGVSVAREHWGMWPKSKNVAMIATHKNSTPGHQLRQVVAQTFGNKIDVFGREAWADKATVLKDYRFVVIIESDRQKDLFTNHLLDAIALVCMPIYWGAPNIGEYLKPEGVWTWGGHFEELSVALEEVEKFGKQVYADSFSALRSNLHNLYKYEFAEDWLYQHYLKDLA